MKYIEHGWAVQLTRTDRTSFLATNGECAIKTYHKDYRESALVFAEELRTHGRIPRRHIKVIRVKLTIEVQP